MKPLRTRLASRGWVTALAFAVGSLGALCLLAPLALAVAGTRLTAYDSGRPVVNACVQAVALPQPHLGLSWRLPSNPKIERSAWIRTYPHLHLLCARVPWPAALPQRGQLLLPSPDHAGPGLPDLAPLFR
jgi:hypothetical protein